MGNAQIVSMKLCHIKKWTEFFYVKERVVPNGCTLSIFIKLLLLYESQQFDCSLQLKEK